MSNNVSVNHVVAPAGGAVTVSLSAGWGASASVSNLFSEGESIRFQITGGASGFSANPSITVTTAATGASSSPVIVADVGVSATGGVIRPYVVDPSATGFTSAVNGLTPAAGGIYEATIKL